MTLAVGDLAHPAAAQLGVAECVAGEWEVGTGLAERGAVVGMAVAERRSDVAGTEVSAGVAGGELVPPCGTAGVGGRAGRVA